MKRTLIIIVSIGACFYFFRTPQDKADTSHSPANIEQATTNDCDLGDLSGTVQQQVLVQILDDESGSYFAQSGEPTAGLDFLRELVKIASCFQKDFVVEFYDHTRPSTRAIVLKLEAISPLPSPYDHINYRRVKEENSYIVRQNDVKIGRFLKNVAQQKGRADNSWSYLNNTISAMAVSAKLQQYSNYEKFSFCVTDLLNDPEDAEEAMVEPEVVESLLIVSTTMLALPGSGVEIQQDYPGMIMMPSRYHFLEELKQSLKQ